MNLLFHGKNLKRPLASGVVATGVQRKEGLKRNGLFVWGMTEIAAL
ncbi:hypothetical protein [Methanospirillum sp.]